MEIKRQCLVLNAILSWSGTSKAILVPNPVADWLDCLKVSKEVGVGNESFRLSPKTWIAHTQSARVILWLYYVPKGGQRLLSFISGFEFFGFCKEVFFESLVLMKYLIKSLQIHYSYLPLWESENLTYCTIKVHLSFACCKILSAKGGSTVFNSFF